MASRDDILRILIRRVDELETRIDYLENAADWDGEFEGPPRDVVTPLAHLGEPDSDIPEDNDAVQMAKQRLNEDPGTNIPSPEPVEYTTLHLKDQIEVSIPVPVDEQLLARQKFIAAGGLANLTSLPSESAESAYLKGGPIWLHAFDRDFVMSLPYEARQAMCQDVYITAPVAAGKMAQDILKYDDASGQSAWAMTKAEQTFDAS